MISREQVYIVDDEPTIRQALSTILASDGYNCRDFESAKDGLRAVFDHAPIAILLDVRMPDMDGIQFLNELRKSNNSVPVIVMTGYADHDVFRQTLKFRIADFLSKPFDPDVVRDSLRKVLGRDDDFTDHFLDTVTHRLREARTELGLKQAEVASRCGMSTSQVSQIELRQSSPSVATLLRLCKALNLTMTELVEGF